VIIRTLATALEMKRRAGRANAPAGALDQPDEDENVDGRRDLLDRLPELGDERAELGAFVTCLGQQHPDDRLLQPRFGLQ
jgi:hypothetical protein